MARVVVVCVIVLCCQFVVFAVYGIRCPFPSYPKNGRVYYSSLDYGAELQYECDKGFMLRNYKPNICNEHGMWRSNVPECIEVICRVPEAPEDGSVLLYEEPPKAGALAFYSCNDGATLYGASTIKCQISGEWTFEPPECLRSCYVPEIFEGEIGRYQKENEFREVFMPLKIGDSVKHHEIVSLRCETEGNATTDTNVECNDGVWSEPLHCRSSTCETEPPQLNNGKPIEFDRVNGSHVDYECNQEYELEGNSTVYCVFGAWVGKPPICKPYDCVIPHLHHGHIMKTNLGDYYWNWKKLKYERGTKFIKIPAGTVLPHGSSVVLFCDTHYFCQGTSLRNQKISCIKGRLMPDAICLQHTPICRLDIDKRSHLIVTPVKSFYRFGEFILLSCTPGYKLANDIEKLMCLSNSWSDTLPNCVEIR